MKRQGCLVKLLFVSILFYAVNTYAQEMASGFYGELLATVSALPSFNNLGTYRPTGIILTSSAASPYGPILYQQARLKNKYGGGGGGSFGYRYNCFRLEGELAYNVNSAQELTYPATKTTAFLVVKNNVQTATSLNQPFLAGQTDEIFGFLNFYYDLLPSAKAETSIYPYLGAGLGYQKMQTVTKFKAKDWTVKQTSSTQKIENVIVSGATGYSYPPCPDGTTTCTEGGISTTSRYFYANQVVGQAIVGLGIEMDSYFNFFFDGRYIFSRSLPEYSSKLQLYTFNLGIHFSFANTGGTR